MSVFIALSVVDTIALEAQFDHFLRKTVGTSWSWTDYDGTCQLIRWIVTTSQVCSAYFVLLFTIERFISVRYPLKRAIFCTKRRINAAILGIVVGCAFISAYELYFNEAMHIGKVFLCFQVAWRMSKTFWNAAVLSRDLNVNVWRLKTAQRLPLPEGLFDLFRCTYHVFLPNFYRGRWKSAKFGFDHSTPLVLQLLSFRKGPRYKCSVKIKTRFLASYSSVDNSVCRHILIHGWPLCFCWYTYLIVLVLLCLLVYLCIYYYQIYGE